ncbi:CDP-alcohol phosphatidyltransferase-domain-containing protein [Blastocladiella britannica]|nr:CDP-alcohol phosphatidyltransferase-domain-containing protein [Blastocladiella britannica]
MLAALSSTCRPRPTVLRLATVAANNDWYRVPRSVATRYMSSATPPQPNQQPPRVPTTAAPLPLRATSTTNIGSEATVVSSSPGTPSHIPAAAAKTDLRENIYTIPNMMSFARLASTPVLGYLIVQGHHSAALGLFAASAVTDMLDGYIARTFNMTSVLGTILDPMADKVLMTTLTVSLGMAGMIPGPMAALIIGRDVGLVLASFVIRYKSLPPPKTFARYWDFSLVSAEVHPTLVSKANTALQLVYVGAALAAPTIPLVGALWAGYGTALQWTVATTTVWSGLSYVLSKDAVKYVNQAAASKEQP